MRLVTLDEFFRTLLRDELRPLQDRIDAIAGALAASTPDGDALVPVKVAARIANVSQGTVRNWLRDGRLRRFGTGRLLRVRRSDVFALLRNENAVAAPESAEDQAARILGRSRSTERGTM